jgi:hypothetical protein
MPHTVIELLFLVNRFVHILCTTVIIGGTLFYEMIVPVAIGELKEEQQLHVFGRARWTFKGVVWTCAALLLISGVVSTLRMWHTYSGGPPSRVMIQVPFRDEPVISQLRRPGWWWAGHAALGLVALVLALLLTNTRRPPRYPLAWMRANLIVLMVVIFLASTARHMRLVNEDAERGRMWPQSAGGD